MLVQATAGPAIASFRSWDASTFTQAILDAAAPVSSAASASASASGSTFSNKPPRWRRAVELFEVYASLHPRAHAMAAATSSSPEAAATARAMSNAVISVCGQAGQWRAAEHYLHDMIARGLRPDATTLAGVQASFAQSAQWEVAIRVFDHTHQLYLQGQLLSPPTAEAHLSAIHACAQLVKDGEARKAKAAKAKLTASWARGSSLSSGAGESVAPHTGPSWTKALQTLRSLLVSHVHGGGGGGGAGGGDSKLPDADAVWAHTHGLSPVDVGVALHRFNSAEAARRLIRRKDDDAAAAARNGASAALRRRRRSSAHDGRGKDNKGNGAMVAGKPVVTARALTLFYKRYAPNMVRRVPDILAAYPDAMTLLPLLRGKYGHIPHVRREGGQGPERSGAITITPAEEEQVAAAWRQELSSASAFALPHEHEHEHEHHHDYAHAGEDPTHSLVSSFQSGSSRPVLDAGLKRAAFNAAVHVCVRSRREKEAAALVGAMVPEDAAAVEASAPFSYWQSGAGERRGCHPDIRPDAVTLNSVLASSRAGKILLGNKPDRSSSSSGGGGGGGGGHSDDIAAAAGAGAIEALHGLSAHLGVEDGPNLRSYNTAIQACARAGRPVEALALYRDLSHHVRPGSDSAKGESKQMLRPNFMTFQQLVYACGHGSTRQRHGVRGGARRLRDQASSPAESSEYMDEVVRIVSVDMPRFGIGMHPDILSALLSAAHAHGQHRTALTLLERYCFDLPQQHRVWPAAKTEMWNLLLDCSAKTGEWRMTLRMLDAMLGTGNRIENALGIRRTRTRTGTGTGTSTIGEAHARSPSSSSEARNAPATASAAALADAKGNKLLDAQSVIVAAAERQAKAKADAQALSVSRRIKLGVGADADVTVQVGANGEAGNVLQVAGADVEAGGTEAASAASRIEAQLETLYSSRLLPETHARLSKRARRLVLACRHTDAAIGALEDLQRALQLRRQSDGHRSGIADPSRYLLACLRRRLAEVDGAGDGMAAASSSSPHRHTNSSHTPLASAKQAKLEPRSSSSNSTLERIYAVDMAMLSQHGHGSWAAEANAPVPLLSSRLAASASKSSSSHAQMRIAPDVITLATALAACNRAGRHAEALQLIALFRGVDVCDVTNAAGYDGSGALATAAAAAATNSPLAQVAKETLHALGMCEEWDAAFALLRAHTLAVRKERQTAKRQRTRARRAAERRGEGFSTSTDSSASKTEAKSKASGGGGPALLWELYRTAIEAALDGPDVAGSGDETRRTQTGTAGGRSRAQILEELIRSQTVDRGVLQPDVYSRLLAEIQTRQLKNEDSNDAKEWAGLRTRLLWMIKCAGQSSAPTGMATTDAEQVPLAWPLKKQIQAQNQARTGLDRCTVGDALLAVSVSRAEPLFTSLLLNLRSSGANPTGPGLLLSAPRPNKKQVPPGKEQERQQSNLLHVLSRAEPAWATQTHDDDGGAPAVLGTAAAAAAAAAAADPMSTSSLVDTFDALRRAATAGPDGDGGTDLTIALRSRCERGHTPLTALTSAWLPAPGATELRPSSAPLFSVPAAVVGEEPATTQARTIHAALVEGRTLEVGALLQRQEQCRADLARAFVAAGADVNATVQGMRPSTDATTSTSTTTSGGTGTTALLLASALPCETVALEMLNLGAAPEISRDVAGTTPLHWAAWWGHEDLASALLSSSSSSDGVAGSQQVVDAMSHADDFAFLHRLRFQSRGATAMGTSTAGSLAGDAAAESDGLTPLHLAAASGSTAIAAMLVAAGADLALPTTGLLLGGDPEGGDSGGVTPRQLAHMFGHVETARVLG